jgi:hypothetical protein
MTKIAATIDIATNILIVLLGFGINSLELEMLHYKA